MGSSFSMIKNSQTALQAQQYVEVAANTLSLGAYEELDRSAHGRQPIVDAAGWEDEIIVGSEKMINGHKQRIATVKVYKTGDTLPRYTLQILLSSEGSSIKKGMIFPWWGDLNNIPAGYAYCDGRNGTPDLRGAYLVSTGNGITLGSRVGSNSTTLVPGNLPGNAFTSLSGYFATGAKWETHESGENNDVVHKYSWGNLSGSKHIPISSSAGNTSFSGILCFDSFNAASSSMGWNGVPFDNRPASVAVHYIMKL